jgi:hypothetical protein
MRSSAIYIVTATTFTQFYDGTYDGRISDVWMVCYRVTREEAEAYVKLCHDQADIYIRWEKTSIGLGDDQFPDWEARLTARRAMLADPKLHYDQGSPVYEVVEVFDDPRENDW